MKKIYLPSIIILSLVIAQPELKKQILCGHSKSLLRIFESRSTLTIEQQKYDALFYRINLDIDPLAETISGTLFARVSILDSTINIIELDFADGMVATAVRVNNLNQTFTHTNNVLSIPAPNDILNDDTLELEIAYNGSPSSTGFGSFIFGSHDNQDLIWTLSEPYGARSWWPCKDDPSDKADSVDIIVRVPSNLIVASNGNLLDTLEMGGRTTYYWQERYPITTYLVSLAIYPYFVWHDQYISVNNDTLPLDYYVFPDHFNSLQENYLLTKDMISVFAGLFGEYPFMDEKYGHAEFGWGGGMEHQTITSLGGWSEALIAHELAHQWWGDMITCSSFHHIWLNEGFATYAEALWWEDKYGPDGLHTDMAYNAYFGGGTIYVENPVTTSDIFNSGLSYRKASWVLHMLRHVVGDDTFFAILLAYGNHPLYKHNSATTEQFQAVCESVSGLNLEVFFQQWIYGSYYPRYSYGWQQNGETLIVNVGQYQTTGTYFQMPIDLKLICNDTTYIEVVNNTQINEEFSIIIEPGRRVMNLVFDPDDWILKSVYSTNNGIDYHGPDKFILQSAYPNPFNAEVTIPFIMQVRGNIEFNIYNLRGELVYSKQGQFDPGKQTLKWNGQDYQGNILSTGVFFIQMNYPGGSKTEKILLLK